MAELGERGAQHEAWDIANVPFNNQLRSMPFSHKRYHNTCVERGDACIKVKMSAVAKTDWHVGTRAYR